MLSQITERINDIRYVELGSNVIRELHIKSFYSEFQVSLLHL